jgi:hypothetical protein
MGYGQPMPYLPQTAYMAGPSVIQTSAMQPIEEDLIEGCGDEDCSCDTCCCDPCCCGPRCRAWFDFMYICARDAEVAWAVPANGTIVDPNIPVIQRGPTAICDFDYEPNFRAGFSIGLDDCGRIGLQYTSFEAATSSTAEEFDPYTLHSLVAHPRTGSASQQYLQGAATYSMDYDLIDVDFARRISCGYRHEISCVLGARYAGMQQDFQSVIGVPTNEEVVTTDVHFDGGGIRVGLETEFYNCCRTCLVYCRSAASFVAGEFDASYNMDYLPQPSVVYNDWRAGRIVTMLDLEVGFGWTCCKGRMRATAGYMVSGWFNTVNTDEWIKAVQTTDYTNLNNHMTFDGAVARVEMRY